MNPLQTCEYLLAKFQKEGDLTHIITTDESWVYQFTVLNWKAHVNGLFDRRGLLYIYICTNVRK